MAAYKILINVLLASLCIISSAGADWINLTGAQSAPNIAEIHVNEDHIRLVLEIYVKDLDKFFDLLKKNKRLKLKEVQKSFKVEPSVVEEWCRLFEEHGLAKMNYPLIGRRFISYVETEKETMLDKEELDAGTIKGHKAAHEGKQKDDKHKFLKLILFGVILFGIIMGAFAYLRYLGMM